MQIIDMLSWGGVAILFIGFLCIFYFILRSISRQDLSGLFQEPDGKASISRFQLFLFTYVVGGLVLILSLQQGTIVDVDETVLGLLGISGGSFLVSKGIGRSGPPPSSTPTGPASPSGKSPSDLT